MWGAWVGLENWNSRIVVHLNKVSTIFLDEIVSIKVLTWPWAIWTDPLIFRFDAFDLQPESVKYFKQEELDALTEKEIKAKCLYYKPFWAEQRD